MMRRYRTVPGRRPTARTTGIVLIGAVALLPAVLHGSQYEAYIGYLIVQIMLLGLYAMAWDFLFGYAGMFSFGHAVFFGTGGYVAAIIAAHTGISSVPLVLGAALAAAFLVGLVVGFFSARVGSVAVFLVTFAVAEAVRLLVVADPGGLTGGDNGLTGIWPGRFLGLDLANQRIFYYVVLMLVVLSYLVLRRLTRSQFGQVLLGIRENEIRIRFAGYRVEQYKTIAFGISGLFAGLAGALTAFHERIASPGLLDWSVSGDALLYATLGGTGTLGGPILGAAIVVIARAVLSNYFSSWLIFVGFTYILLVFFLPSGLYPLVFQKKTDRNTT